MEEQTASVGAWPDRKELAQFLRARRERLSPEEFGITANPSRRTPGLRREEVAFLANIGVKWYASLESGDEIHPSPKTLLAIAKALRLSRIDTDYIFRLTGLSAPADPATDYAFKVPQLFDSVMNSLHGVAAAVWDLMLTPLAWNDIFDGVMGSSTFPSPLERNMLVQAFGPSGFIKHMTGSEFTKLASNAVGMLRRYLTYGEPTPFARQVYERVKNSPEFQAIWDARTVSDHLLEGSSVVREHPKLGTLTMQQLDLYLHHREDIVLKLWFPADDKTAEIFNALEAQAATRGYKARLG